MFVGNISHSHRRSHLALLSQNTFSVLTFSLGNGPNKLKQKSFKVSFYKYTEKHHSKRITERRGAWIHQLEWFIFRLGMDFRMLVFHHRYSVIKAMEILLVGKDFKMVQNKRLALLTL